METYEGREFRNQRIELDDCNFINCIFQECELVYRGTGVVGMTGTGAIKCNWIFDGAAGMTMKFVRDAYRGFGEYGDAWLRLLLEANDGLPEQGVGPQS